MDRFSFSQQELDDMDVDKRHFFLGLMEAQQIEEKKEQRRLEQKMKSVRRR